MIISFGATSPALLAGRKTRTRRDWKPSHAAKFHPGMVCEAYDKSPRNGGRPVAFIRLTSDPFQQSTNLLEHEDWEKEGFDYLTERGLTVFGKPPRELWDEWVLSPRNLWVVDFRLMYDR